MPKEKRVTVVRMKKKLSIMKSGTHTQPPNFCCLILSIYFLQQLLALRWSTICLNWLIIHCKFSKFIRILLLRFISWWNAHSFWILLHTWETPAVETIVLQTNRSHWFDRCFSFFNPFRSWKFEVKILSHCDFFDLVVFAPIKALNTPAVFNRTTEMH